MGRIQKEVEQGRKRDSTTDKQWTKHHLNKVASMNAVEYTKAIPYEALDCTITFPLEPINLDGETAEQNTLQDSSSSMHNSLSWKDHVLEQTALLKEVYRATKPGGHLWYFTNVNYEGHDICHPIEWMSRTPWKVRQEIVWLERAMFNFKPNPRRFTQNERRIFWLRKEPGPSLNLRTIVCRWGSVWSMPKVPDKMFSHLDYRLPLYLTLAIIHGIDLPSESVIFDPFGGPGAGSTAKACQLANQHFLTTESNSLYNKMITDRLKETSEGDKFWSSLISKQIHEETLNISQTLEK